MVLTPAIVEEKIILVLFLNDEEGFIPDYCNR